MEELKRMDQELKNNEELQNKFKEAIEAAVKNGANSDGEAMVMAAKSLGYNIKISDLEKAKAEELSDDELDNISGGTPEHEDEHGHSVWCVAAWHCTMAMLHTEAESHDVACWADYTCYFINKSDN